MHRSIVEVDMRRSHSSQSADSYRFLVCEENSWQPLSKDETLPARFKTHADVIVDDAGAAAK